ncbi:hypothetical protein [uncultured Mediterranean phage uvMED]|nr:hypothetical protein [uncultured Mediterranean phage uvMED]BAR22566.1 hypothetical protein [uncultured Mediterranean phage uvMED]
MSLTITKLSNGKVRFDEVGGLQRNYDANYDVAESTRADYIVILAPEGNRLEEFKFSDVAQLVDAEGGTVDNPDLATLLEELSTNYFDGSGLGGGGSSAVDINKQRFEMSSKFDSVEDISTTPSLYTWVKFWSSINYEVKNLVPHKITISGWYNIDDNNDTAQIGALIGGEYLGNSDFTDETLEGRSATGGISIVPDPQRIIYAMERDSVVPDGPHARAQVVPVHFERTFNPSSLGSKELEFFFLWVNTFHIQLTVEIEEIAESGVVVLNGTTTPVDINKQRFEMPSGFQQQDVLDYIAANSPSTFDWIPIYNGSNYEVKNLVPHKVTVSGWASLDDINDVLMLGFTLGGETLGMQDYNPRVLDGQTPNGVIGTLSDPERLFYAIEQDSLAAAGQQLEAAVYPIHLERVFNPNSLGQKEVEIFFSYVNNRFSAQFSVEIEEIKESGGVVVGEVTKTGNGFIDYNDTTGGVSLTANTWTDIPNDGAGAFTNKNYPATGVTELMDTSTGYIDCTELTLGDTILVRNDFKVNPAANNALLEMRYELGNGGGVYTLETILGRLDSGSGQDYRLALKPDLIYMGDTNTRDNPIKIQVRCSANATLTNAGSVIQVIKR